MSEINVQLSENRAYSIHFERLESIGEHLVGTDLVRGKALLVTDETVGGLYEPRLSASLRKTGYDLHTFVIPDGEASKSFSELQRLYDWALSLSIDRRTPVVALGGGVVGDLAGYAAATLLRGLPLIHVPTSLIAQADSSIGGKTGINHTSGKNLIGAFYQPDLVLTDTSTLSTLSDRDYHSGLAEVVKHALIADADFFGWLEDRWDSILECDATQVEEMVRRAASIKARIVEAD
ncbi:MAG: 3-dehydroquinate synthase family protein, partial [Rubricoccaceae bacterium]|nr:3-dehydroquinate synthase family protein [Rubricoccaceae bacterium]